MEGDDLGVAVINDYICRKHTSAVECSVHPVKGRILVAGRRFQAGEVIFTEQTLAELRVNKADAKFLQLAAFCEEVGADLGAQWYCAALQSLTASEEESSGWTWKPMDRATQLLLLQLHTGERPQDKHMKAIAERFAPLEVQQDAELLDKSLHAWVFNAFELGDAHDDSIEVAMAVYFLPSFMSHSCAPSASWCNGEGQSFELRARQDLAAGDEITISYLSEAGLLEPTIDRRSSLHASKGFWCSCERCSAQSDLSRGMRCPSCHQGCIFAALRWSDVAQRIFLQPLRPCNYDEQLASDKDVWLTFGTPSLQQKSGRFYYELLLGSGLDEPQVGWATDAFEEAPDWTGDGAGDDQHSWAADGLRQKYWHCGEPVDMPWPQGWQEGSVIGCAVDIDNGILSFAVDGHWQADAERSAEFAGRSLFPAVSLSGQFTLHLDPDSFVYGPPDSSYRPLAPLGSCKALQPLDRQAPLRNVFLGCCCDACGAPLDDAHAAQRLVNLEAEWGRHLAQLPVDDVIPEELLEAAEQALETQFSQHILAYKVRRRLAKNYAAESKLAKQCQALEDCCSFSRSAFPGGMNAEHARALISLADALSDKLAVEEECCAERERVRGFYQEAGHILEVLFGPLDEDVVRIRSSLAEDSEQVSAPS